MSEEKKENIEAAKPAPEPAKAAEPAVKPPEPAAKEGEKPVKKEKPVSCASCNKSIRKKRWYYRNGKYYCSKPCWHKAAKKKEEPKAEAPA